MAAEVDVSSVSSQEFRVYSDYVDQRIERYLWHLEDEPVKDVAAEISEEFSYEDLEIAREALFVQAKIKAAAKNGDKDKGNQSNIDKINIATGVNKYADPWGLIKRRAIMRLATDLCTLYRYLIGKEKDFPCKMLRRKAITAVENIDVLGENNLNTILETTESSGQADSKTQEATVSTKQVKERQETVEEIVDFLSLEVEKDPVAMETKPNDSQQPRNNEYVMFSEPTIVNEVQCDHPNQQGSIDNASTIDMQIPDGQPVPDKSLSATGSGMQSQSSGVTQHAKQPPMTKKSISPEPINDDPTQLPVPKGNPAKRLQCEPGNLSQESFLREIQEIQDRICTSTPNEPLSQAKRSGVKPSRDMATQTQRVVVPDHPVLRSEFDALSEYTQGALTDHERRIKAQEVSKLRMDRKIDDVDAVYHNQTSGIRSDMNSVLQDVDGMKSLLVQIFDFMENQVVLSCTSTRSPKKSGDHSVFITTAPNVRPTVTYAIPKSKSPRRKKRIVSGSTNIKHSSRTGAPRRLSGAYDSFMRDASKAMSQYQDTPDSPPRNKQMYASNRARRSQADDGNRQPENRSNNEQQQPTTSNKNPTSTLANRAPMDTSTPKSQQHHMSISWADDEHEDSKAIDEYLTTIGRGTNPNADVNSGVRPTAPTTTEHASRATQAPKKSMATGSTIPHPGGVARAGGSSSGPVRAAVVQEQIPPREGVQQRANAQGGARPKPMYAESALAPAATRDPEQQRTNTQGGARPKSSYAVGEPVPFSTTVRATTSLQPMTSTQGTRPNVSASGAEAAVTRNAGQDNAQIGAVGEKP